MDDTRMAIVDTGVLMHQVPGGMISNLVSQLKEARAIHRLQEVLHEIPRTRRDLGMPPLVTPTSQIVGAQALQNVLLGRYKMVSTQVQDYVYGLYGRPPMPIDPEVQAIALKRCKRGKEPITCRPGDVIAPELEKVKQATRDLARDMGEVLICALYPETGARFLRWKHGLEPVPDELTPKTLEDVRNEDEQVARAILSLRTGTLRP
jgi:pyruvate carboxylase subunit B